MQTECVVGFYGMYLPKAAKDRTEDVHLHVCVCERERENHM